MIAHPQELVLAATIHRVKLCEDRIKEFEQMVSTLTSQMAQNREELASKGLASLIMGTSTQLDIPKELRPTIGKYRMPRNRSFATVTKRWALWKAQLASGMNIHELAKAWGCDHTTIRNAKERGFVARKSRGCRK